MKKLIMLSMFALGTITASASNDFFKNKYEKSTEQPPFELQSNWRIKIWLYTMNSDGSLKQTLVKDFNVNCFTVTQANNRKSQEVMSYYPEYAAGTIEKISDCFVIIP